MLEYEKYMSRCLQLAKIGEYYVAPNPMVGAVLVNQEGKILAEGWHKIYGSAHAEVNCFLDYEEHYSNPIPKESTLFVSLEPCSHYGKTPPCADLIISKGIKKVVVGCLDPNPLVAGKGIEKLKNAGIEVISGILEKECRELNKRFFCLQEKHRPYIILKWAQTADGFLDYTRTIGSQTSPLVISTEVTKQLVHKMRAENMSILIGSGTALLDDPKLLTTRWSGRNPIRILLDKRKRVPTDARIFSNDAQTIVYSDNTEWEFVIKDLASRGIHSVLVEGGANVLNHIINSGIYDEIHIEVNPRLSIGVGVAAPKISLTNSQFEEIDGNQLYTLLNFNSKQ